MLSPIVGVPDATGKPRLPSAMGELRRDFVVVYGEWREVEGAITMRWMKSLLVTGLMGGIECSAKAQVIPVTNPSFESPSLGPCSFNADAAGWTESGNAGVWGCGSLAQCLNSYRIGPPAGAQIGFINSGTLTQTVAANLTANTRYTLQVKVGRRYDCCQSSGTDYTVQLLAGAAVLAQDAGSIVITNGTFRMTTVRFSTGATHPNLGQALQIRLLQGTNGQANFDDVQLTAAPADCNSNGIFDAIDISNGAPDVNANGVPDSCETRTCAADVAPPVTGDNLVNVSDLLSVISQWGPCISCASDFVPAHGNQQVNVSDLLGVISAWGPCP